MGSEMPTDQSPVQDHFIEPPVPAGEPRAASFAPPEWQEPLPASTPFAPGPWAPPTEEKAPEPPAFTPEPSPFATEQPPFAPTGWQESAPIPASQETIPPFADQPPVESPFQVAAEQPTSYTAEPVFAAQPVPEPILTAAAPAAEVSPPPATADTDRVDDLLRQFRERYGRGSL
jgi:hypothetical protein